MRNCSVECFRGRLYSRLTCFELHARMQPFVDSCGCHASKQSDSRDRGLVSSLPIPYCANSLLYVDSIQGLPKLGGYVSCLALCCGLTRFTTAFPCRKMITGDQTVNILVEQWFEHYRAPKEVHSAVDVVRTAQGNKRTQSLVGSCFIKTLRFCWTTHRGLKMYCMAHLWLHEAVRGSSTRLYHPKSLRMRSGSPEVCGRVGQAGCLLLRCSSA